MYKKEKHILLLLLLLAVIVSVIDGRPKDVFRYVIIILLYFLHVIDDIWNNIYVVVVSNL